MTSDYNTATEAPAEGAITLPLSALLESLLFVADGPVPLAQFAAALESTPRTIEAALDELDALYQHRGLRIQRDKAGVQLTTAPQTAEAVEKFLGLESLQRLSKPAVETLAIIAYQQPITRPRIEAIRGVNSDGVIKSLLTKGLIEEVGRTEGPGRPVLYGTTPAFLQHFGLSSLTDLPPLDIEAVLAAARITGPESEAASAPQPDTAPETPATEVTSELVVEAVEIVVTDVSVEAESEPEATLTEAIEIIAIETEATSEPVTQSDIEEGAPVDASVEADADIAPEADIPELVEELTQVVADVEVLVEPEVVEEPSQVEPVEILVIEANGDNEDDVDEDDDEEDEDDDWDDEEDEDEEDDDDDSESSSSLPEEPQP